MAIGSIMTGAEPWYSAFNPETAISEVSYHLTRELEAIERPENTTDYAELIADFFGPFYDPRASDFSAHPALLSDPAAYCPANGVGLESYVLR